MGFNVNITKNKETARVHFDASYTEAGIVKLAVQLLATLGNRTEKKPFSPKDFEEVMFIVKDCLKHNPNIADSAEEMADAFNRIDIFFMHSYASTK